MGKSQMVAQVAAKPATAVIDIRLSQMEASDLRGISFRLDNIVEWAVPALLPDAKRHGATGILFLDEITSAAPTVSAVACHRYSTARAASHGPSSCESNAASPLAPFPVCDLTGNLKQGYPEVVLPYYPITA